MNKDVIYKNAFKNHSIMVIFRRIRVMLGVAQMSGKPLLVLNPLHNYLRGWIKFVSGIGTKLF